MSGVGSVNSKIEAKCKMNSGELAESLSNTLYIQCFSLKSATQCKPTCLPVHVLQWEWLTSTCGSSGLCCCYVRLCLWCCEVSGRGKMKGQWSMRICHTLFKCKMTKNFILHWEWTRISQHAANILHATLFFGRRHFLGTILAVKPEKHLESHCKT